MAVLYAGLTYEETVRRYASTVAGVCLMRLQNYADAEDCFQNTFLKLLTKSPSFKDETHLKAWLIKVAVNECLNFIKKKRREIPLETLPDEPVYSTDDKTDISWALMKLRPDYREILYLYYVEEYRIKEIAEILGKNRIQLR